MTNSYPSCKNDYGPTPYVTNVTSKAIQNGSFRTALWTGQHLQMTIMSIPPCSDIGLEIHEDTDQIIHIEQGMGILKMGKCKSDLNWCQNVCTGDSLFIPAGIWHNLLNCYKTPLKVSSIYYGPPHHPAGLVQCNK